jgi:hypothetical protein
MPRIVDIQPMGALRWHDGLRSPLLALGGCMPADFIWKARLENLCAPAQ